MPQLFIPYSRVWSLVLLSAHETQGPEALWLVPNIQNGIQLKYFSDVYSSALSIALSMDSIN